jgi:aspartate/methionine/tyrosine aminotransferase
MSISGVAVIGQGVHNWFKHVSSVPSHTLWLFAGMFSVFASSFLPPLFESRRKVKKLALSKRAVKLTGRVVVPGSPLEEEIAYESKINNAISLCEGAKAQHVVHVKCDGKYVGLACAGDDEHQIVSVRCGAALSRLLVHRVFTPCHHFDSNNNIMLGAGGAAVLRLTLTALADEGDGVLVPTPADSAVLQDVAYTGLLPVLCAFSPTMSPKECFTCLRKARHRARADGVHTKVLLVSSPSSMSGCLYSEGALRAALQFCRLYGLHLITDESACLKVHRIGSSFASAQSLDGPSASPLDVHTIMDCGVALHLPGASVGMLCSRNKGLVAVCHEGAKRTCPPSICSMEKVMSLVDSKVELDTRLAEHIKLLRERYCAMADELERCGIRFVHCEAGVSLILDLREHVKTVGLSLSATRDLWWHLLEEEGLNLCPIFATMEGEAGWFQAIYAFHEPAELRGAVCKLARALQPS